MIAFSCATVKRNHHADAVSPAAVVIFSQITTTMMIKSLSLFWIVFAMRQKGCVEHKPQHNNERATSDNTTTVLRVEWLLMRVATDQCTAAAFSCCPHPSARLSCRTDTAEKSGHNTTQRNATHTAPLRSCCLCFICTVLKSQMLCNERMTVDVSQH